jgi:protein-tyrosine kinase
MADNRGARKGSEVEASSPAQAPPEGSGSKASLVVMVSDPAGATAEAIRALRTRVVSQHVHAGGRALTLCGPTPEVGCTFMAANLAVALAQVGTKTLLIDCDMRNPSLQDYFGVDNVGGGLHAALTSGEAVDDLVKPDVHPNLDILFAGRADLAAQELLSAERFVDLANACLRDYDMTIIDTPPANSCADGRRVSTVFGYSLIVARRNRTLVADVRTLADQLRKERATVIGSVLNAF